MVNKKYIRCDIVIKEILDILYIIVFSLLFILNLDINISFILLCSLCSFLYLKYM